MKNGFTRNIAIASAIGINFIAPKKSEVAIRINKALMKCRKVSFKLGKYKTFRYMAIGIIIKDWTRNLENEICPIGIAFDANLAKVSITGPSIVKPITSNIPNNG